MTDKFLPKDSTKAIVDIKEILYNRMQDLQGYIAANKDYSKQYGLECCDKVELSVERSCWQGEITFLQNLLDMIERS